MSDTIPGSSNSPSNEAGLHNSSSNTRTIPPMKRPAPAPPIGAGEGTRKNTNDAGPGSSSGGINTSTSPSSSSDGVPLNSPRRSSSGTIAIPGAAANSDKDEGGNKHTSNGSLGKKEKKSLYTNWRKIKKGALPVGGSMEDFRLEDATEFYHNTPPSPTSSRNKKKTNDKRRRSRSEVCSDDEYDRNPYIDEFANEQNSSPRAGRAPTLVRRSIQRVVEDWAGEDLPGAEEEQRGKRRSLRIFSSGEADNNNTNTTNNNNNSYNKEKEREAKERINHKAQKELRKENKQMKETLDSTVERLERVENAVDKLASMLELHHEKQSVELSRFVMVITSEIGSGKKEKEEVAKQAARIDALERTLQETKQNMMEALVLNAKKVELIAKKDKRIEELEYLLKLKNEGVDISTTTSMASSIRMAAIKRKPLPQPASSTLVSNPGEKEAEGQDLPPLTDAPPLPLLSLAIDNPNTSSFPSRGSTTATRPASPGSSARRRAESCKSAGNELKPAPFSSPIVIGRPAIKGSAGGAVPVRPGGATCMSDEETNDKEEEEGQEGDGDQSRYSTLRGGMLRPTRGNKAMRTLGVTPSQEKLMNVLGLDMPPDLTFDRIAEPEEEDAAKTTNKTPKIFHLLKGGKKKDKEKDKDNKEKEKEKEKDKDKNN